MRSAAVASTYMAPTADTILVRCECGETQLHAPEVDIEVSAEVPEEQLDRMVAAAYAAARDVLVDDALDAHVAVCPLWAEHREMIANLEREKPE